MDYKGLIDRHLNVFCGYGVEHLENNITKALINTINSFNHKDLKFLLEKMTGIEFQSDIVKADTFLQKKPHVDLIKNVPIHNRYIIGISPTGKCWGYNSQDVQDEKKLEEEISNEWKKSHPDVSDEDLNIIVKETIKDIKLNRFDKGSIPDAWIFIELSSEQIYLFIIENKKYNLDPNQINNHIEKSLFQIKDSDKNKPIYRSFVELSKCMEGIKTYMSEQFAEYLMILGYVGLESLPLACLADVDIRKNLAMNAGRTVMKEIFGQDVNDRSSSTVRYTIKPHFDFLREVNLCFDRCDKEDGTIYVSLALAPTMNSAKKMYELIDFKTHFKNEHIKYPKESFHLQYNRGRNIRKSYINGFNWNFNDYIKYWKNNTKKLHLMSTIEAGEFIVDLSKQGNYPCNQAEKFKDYIIKRHNPINVVPELIYEISWTCEEISQMNSNYEFENSLKKALSEVLDMLNLKIVGINNM